MWFQQVQSACIGGCLVRELGCNLFEFESHPGRDDSVGLKSLLLNQTKPTDPAVWFQSAYLARGAGRWLRACEGAEGPSVMPDGDFFHLMEARARPGGGGGPRREEKEKKEKKKRQFDLSHLSLVSKKKKRGGGGEKKRRGTSATRDSNVVTNRSTNQARSSLTSLS